MPNGKPAGVPCVQLDEQNRCQLFDNEDRPALCSRFQAGPEICGNSRDEALSLITQLEQITVID
jgi:uncharacterized protein